VITLREQQSLWAGEFCEKFKELRKKARYMIAYDGSSSPAATAVMHLYGKLLGRSFSTLQSIFTEDSGKSEQCVMKEELKRYVHRRTFKESLKRAVETDVAAAQSFANLCAQNFDQEYPSLKPLTHNDGNWMDVKKARSTSVSTIKINFTKERNTMQSNITKAIVVSVGGATEGIVLPYSEELVNALMMSRVVNVRRGANTQSADVVTYTSDVSAPKVVIVKSSELQAAPTPKVDRLVVADESIAKAEQELARLHQVKKEIGESY
jgi:hypothetical protein